MIGAKRFIEFGLYLRMATGDRAHFDCTTGQVTIRANEFSPEQTFRSVQAAIDHFARILPAQFVNLK